MIDAECSTQHYETQNIRSSSHIHPTVHLCNDAVI